MKRWVVQVDDGATVGDVLPRMGADARAIAEGRVFLGKRRVIQATERVREGDELRVAVPAPRAVEVPILFQRDGLVACVKPAGLASVPDHGGAADTLVGRVAAQLKIQIAELRVTSRLDRDVSGVVIFARTEAAEARLRQARAEGRYVRRYLALAQGDVEASSGVWRFPIGRASSARLRAVNGTDPKPAQTRWCRIARAQSVSLFAFEPITGRTHQLRAHAAHVGCPLLGDRDYHGPARLTLPTGRVLPLVRVYLHAARVAVPGLADPSRGSVGETDVLVAEAPVPEELKACWAALGGAAEAWNTALSWQPEVDSWCGDDGSSRS